MKQSALSVVMVLLLVATPSGCPDDSATNPADAGTTSDTVVDSAPADIPRADSAPEIADASDSGPPSTTDGGDISADDGRAHDGVQGDATAAEDSAADGLPAELPGQDTAAQDASEADAMPIQDASPMDVTEPPDAGDGEVQVDVPMDVSQPDVAPTCGAITFQGCCDGTVLKFCELGVLVEVECAPTTCGWFPDFGEGIYACGEQGEDPSGNVPLDCPPP